MSTYTGSLKIGTPKNREFWEILAFSKTCDLLKIGILRNRADFTGTMDSEKTRIVVFRPKV